MEAAACLTAWFNANRLGLAALGVRVTRDEVTGGDSAPQQVRLLRRAGLAAFALAAITFATGLTLRPDESADTAAALWMLLAHDLTLVCVLFAAAAAALFAGDRAARAQPFALPLRAIILLAVLVAALSYAGRLLILDGYDLVRDEQMTMFDAWVYRHGQLAWPLAAEWREHARALNLVFMYPDPHPAAWVSTYLPGNALLHALVGLVFDPAATSPLLAGGSVIALWSCARKIWPDDREVAVVCVILLIVSGQFLFLAMTPWAMTAHLFCNLLWLRLFLSRRRGTDLAALLVGFLATGLHQMLFHPLFAAPVLATLLLGRDWRRAAFFAAGYAAVCLLWLAWPLWINTLVSPAGVMQHDGLSSVSIWQRLISTIMQGGFSNAAIMAANLLRFMTWNHLLLLPLIFAGLTWVRRDHLAGALALGIGLTIIMVTIILPSQGYGFGYRYLHPVLGSAVLLAGYGWRSLPALQPRLRAVLIVSSLIGIAAVLPLQAWFAHARVHFVAQANASINRSGADYLLLNHKNGRGYSFLVFNAPDLSNRPIRLTATSVPDHARLARQICRKGVVVAMPDNAFYAPGFASFAIAPFNTADATLARLRVPYEAAGCSIKILR